MEKLDINNQDQNQLGIVLEETASALTQGYPHGKSAESADPRFSWK